MGRASWAARYWRLCSPRTRGDGPDEDYGDPTGYDVLPAHAGMSRAGAAFTHPSLIHPMFNLLTEPWIPLVASDGSMVSASIRDALLQPNRWTGIATVSPVECIALHRLLLAIAHRAIGPGDLAQRSALLDTWPTHQVDAYLQQWEERFNLHHPTHPFLQTPGLDEAGAQPSPWMRLTPDRACGNTRVLWDHSIHDQPTPITPAEAARALVAHQQFTTEGLLRFIRTSAARGPACGVQLVIPTGDTLQQTLAFNLLPQTAADHQRDLPPWEVDLPAPLTFAETIKVVPVGPVQRYAWLARCIQLLPLEDGTITHLLYGPAYAVGESPTPDPMTPMVTGKEGPLPLLLREGRSFWRDFHALTGGEGSAAPAVAAHAATLQMMRGSFDPLELIAGGMANKQAKVLFWRLEFRRVSPALLQQGAAASIAQSAVTLADTVGTDLRKAISVLFSNWLSANGAGAGANKTAVSQLHQSTQAMALYWAALEPEFWALVHQLSSGLSPDEVVTTWAETLHRVIRQTWRHATDQLGRDGRALAAAARSDRALGRVIASTTPAG